MICFGVYLLNYNFGKEKCLQNSFPYVILCEKTVSESIFSPSELDHLKKVDVMGSGYVSMKILSLGSLNIDHVYNVSHINVEGETLSAKKLEHKQGGKGLNQSVALARAGAQVSMAGCVGADGTDLIDTLRQAGVDVRFIREVDDLTGHAIIQLADSGANSIIIYGGANMQITPQMIDETLDHFHPGDYILLQNEISNADYAICAAKDRGMTVVFNPSPISEEMTQYPLELVDIFILNELEGQKLSGAESDDGKTVLAALAERFPHAVIVLTLGSDGVMYHDAANNINYPAYKVPVVDTTGAGDTFCGYFLACSMRGDPPHQALATATKASAIAVGKKGAAVSIPAIADVESSNFGRPVQI